LALVVGLRGRIWKNPPARDDVLGTSYNSFRVKIAKSGCVGFGNIRALYTLAVYSTLVINY